MIVKCEKCLKEFESSGLRLKIVKIGCGLEETSFRCPHCKQKYPVITTNPEIRRLQREQMRLMERIKGQDREMNTEELLIFTARQAEIKKLLNVLNGKEVKNE